MPSSESLHPQVFRPHEPRPRRIAVFHDWLPLYGGAERVLEQILVIYPEADVFSLIDNLPEGSRHFLRGHPVTTSFIQRLPGGKRFYRHFFPLMPLAVEQFDLSGYDLVISSSYAFAKGVLTGPRQLHICYCHSPIRYAWDLQHQYLKESRLERGPLSWIVRLMLHYIRIWDSRTAAGVDEFVANSGFVARRIRKVYRRDSVVIYPPVDTERFARGTQPREDFYFTVSRMVPYKRMDLVIEAFNAMPDRRLVVVGDGPELSKLREMAGTNIELRGFGSNEVVLDLMQRCRAFIFAAEEDFGIVAVEAQACGTPVVAYGQGGAKETVVHLKTGVLFEDQTKEALIAAVHKLEESDIDPIACREHATRFSTARFKSSFGAHVEQAWAQFQGDNFSGD